MSDLIDRQKAIDAIRASTSKYTGFMEMEMYTDDDAVEAIKALPSAQRKGKWYAIGNTCLATCECGYITDRHSVYNFCPKCGADMRKEAYE